MGTISDSADRPANEPTEFEVTPEMIEAGAEILKAYNANYCVAEEVVSELFRAMMGKYRTDSTCRLT
jgi:hypothetical protein